VKFFNAHLTFVVTAEQHFPSAFSLLKTYLLSSNTLLPLPHL